MIYSSEQPIVFVVGLDSIQGLQTARTFHRHNVPVIGIAHDKKYHACRTRVCKQKLYVNTESDDLIKLLEQIGPKLKMKAVLIPCQDLIVRIVSKQRDKLLQWYHVMLPEHEVIEKLLNKAKFYQHVIKEKLPLSLTYIIEDDSDLDDFKGKISYPCILKPDVRTSEWLEATPNKAFKIFNEKELVETYQNYCSLVDTMIVQEWVDGEDFNLYTCFCYYDNSSNPVITFISKKIRQWPPLIGQRCMGVECENDFVKKVTLDLYNSVSFKGLGYLEMKKDEATGKYNIIEANVGRPVGPSDLAERAGVEILYTMYCDCVGLKRPENLQQQYLDTKWVHLLRDFQAFLYYKKRGEITFGDWIKSFRGRKAFAIFSWNDPLPFLFALLRIIRIVLFFPWDERKIYSQKPQ